MIARPRPLADIGEAGLRRTAQIVVMSGSDGTLEAR
jgi:hypothetical protein